MKVPAEFEGVFQGIELTEREIGFLVWVAGWDSYTITNLQSVIQKVRAKAIGDVSQPSNEPPPCYQPDGDGCAYQCYDGDDEPIAKCKECPLCYSDKQRHHTPPNEPLTLEQLREMDGEPVYMVDLTGGTLWDQWIIFERHTYDGFIPRGGGYFGCASYGRKWLAYRRPPEGEV